MTIFTPIKMLFLIQPMASEHAMKPHHNECVVYLKNFCHIFLAFVNRRPDIQKERYHITLASRKKALADVLLMPCARWAFLITSR